MTEIRNSLYFLDLIERSDQLVPSDDGVVERIIQKIQKQLFDAAELEPEVIIRCECANNNKGLARLATLAGDVLTFTNRPGPKARRRSKPIWVDIPVDAPASTTRGFGPCCV